MMSAAHIVMRQEVYPLLCTSVWRTHLVDYLKRKRQIQQLMEAKGVDAMLVAGVENYYYITGD